jgi:selenocysteine lyase/cysteine desulfurase
MRSQMTPPPWERRPPPPVAISAAVGPSPSTHAARDLTRSRALCSSHGAVRGDVRQLLRRRGQERVGFMHYNTAEEIDRLLEALAAA